MTVTNNTAISGQRKRTHRALCTFISKKVALGDIQLNSSASKHKKGKRQNDK
jgi:hypothetical protein